MDWKKLQSHAASAAKATGHAANGAYKAGKAKYNSSSTAQPHSTPPLATRPAQAPSVPPALPPALPPRLPSRASSVAPVTTHTDAPADEAGTPSLPSRADVAGRQAAIRASYGTAVTSEQLQKPPVSKRAPPPPPRSSRPPVPLATRPTAAAATRGDAGVHPDCSKLPLFRVPQLAQDLQIPLSPPWYAQQPLVLPQVMTATGSYTYGASGSGFPGRIQYTQIYALQHADLSQTKVKLQFNENNPTGTVHIEQRHLPRPKPMTTAQLIACSEQLGPALVAYCRSHWGQQVGNGECWTLASDGLQSIPGAVASQGVVHGHPIYTRSAQTPTIQIEQLRPGDVIQYLSAKFHDLARGTTSWAGMPDHTAIITSTEPLSHGGVALFPEVTCILAEQNVGGVKRVQEGRIALGTLVEGTVTVYRPVSSTWLTPLTPDW